jgi:starch synthase
MLASSTSRVRVLHVSSEVAPFAHSGGLGDVLAGLPPALAAAHGLDVAIVVPLYRVAAERLAADGIALADGGPLALHVGASTFHATLRVARIGRVAYGFVDCAPLYDRAGTLYGPGGPGEFGDNHVRFAALGRAALAGGARLLDGPIDVLHVHDWQAGPAAIYARVDAMPVKIVATIHNLAYRGIFPKTAMTELGIPWSTFDYHHVEFYDQVSLLKGALAYADIVTTVSPTYAREILTPERGEVLDGFLRWDVKRLVGIVNGIDAVAYDPVTDRALPARFSRDAIAGKATCKAELLRELALPVDDAPLVGAIGRMTDQKGFDLIADIVPELARLGARLVVLGSGEPHIEERFRWLAGAFADRVAVRVGFDIALARRIYAGADLFAMPSRFEPCGLGQLYAMRYGTIPIVHAVGGLRDTVIDVDGPRATGIRFDVATPSALAHALARGVSLVRDPLALATVRRAAMTRDSSWTASAQQYVQLYRSLQ